MLLRRVIEHFREQEWTAIFLDFLIVVVGVFVGLQVNNWNEARRERAKEAFAIAALRSDFQALDFSVSHGVCWHRRALDGLQVIAESLNNGRFNPEVKARFENGLRFGFLNASTNKAMGLVSDPALRAALIAYEGSRETAALSRADIMIISNNYIRSFTDQFDYDLQRDHFRTDQDSPLAFHFSAIGDYDFDSMLADQEFREAVFELREMQRIYLEWEDGSLRQVREIQRMLGDQPLDEVRCK